MRRQSTRRSVAIVAITAAVTTTTALLLLSSSSVAVVVVVDAFSTTDATVGSRRGSSGTMTTTTGFWSPKPTTTTPLFGYPGGDGDEESDDDDTTISGFFVRKRVRNLTRKIGGPWSGGETATATTPPRVPPNGSSSSVSAVRGFSPETLAIVDEAFGPAEASLREMEDALATARTALGAAKLETCRALEAALPAATAPPDTAYADDPDDLSGLAFEDIDYDSSEMAPPFLDQDSCLMPDAEPLVRVEKAPDNSRRIFAGIDISASTDDVWKVRRHTAQRTRAEAAE